MTPEQKNVRDWMAAFGQETPTKPTIPSLEVRKLRAKLILEEAFETVYSLGLRAYPQTIGELNENEIKFYEDSDWNAVADNKKLKDIADGCEDLKVVTEGTLVACGLVYPNNLDEVGHMLGEDKNESVMMETPNGDPLFDEVMRSNWSKMWNGNELGQLENGHVPKEHTVEFVTSSNVKGKPKLYIVKDSNGKVIKSPSYSPANLQPIIEEMSK